MEEDAWLPWRVTKPGRRSQGIKSVKSHRGRDRGGGILGEGMSLSLVSGPHSGALFEPGARGA